MTESGWSETAQGLLQKAGRWLSRPRPAGNRPVRIGVALGGGFARGIAHVGVLRALERNGVEVACIAGVSAGSIVAAAYASGASVDEIEQVARGVRFKDVARWTVSRFGLAETDRMVVLLKRLLKTGRFESDAIADGGCGQRPDVGKAGSVPRFGRRLDSCSGELRVSRAVSAGAP